MDVQVDGAGELVNRLARFDKDVYKVLQREIRGSMRSAAQDIRMGMPSDKPLSGSRGDGSPTKGWGPWSDAATRRGASQVGSVSVSAFSGRDLGYDPAKVAASVVYGAKQARIRRAGVVGIRGWAGVKNAGGSIFTTAGSEKGRGSTNTVFVKNLRRKHGNKYPRVLTGVYAERAREIGAQIDAALDRARRSIGL